MNTNVYACYFGLDNIQGYAIRARVSNSGLSYPETRDIFVLQFGERSPEIEKKYEAYFPLSYELERTNNFFIRSRIVPDSLWIGVEETKMELPTPQDYLFSVWSGGMVLNEDCARILQQHRLGENILTPVQIYDLATGALSMDDTFYFINLYERREYMSDVQTGRYLEPRDKGNNKIAFYGGVVDGDVNVNHSVLDCDVDLWIDPKLPDYFFMSGTLHQALSQANMIEKFSPRICTLV